MNKKHFVVIVTLVVLLLATVVAVSANGNSDLSRVRRATARFHRSEVAEDAGWGLVPTLDHCFEKPDVGGMGFHYINGGILDGVVNVLEPEAMVYVPGPNGQLQLGAVEYIVDPAAWTAAGNTGLPMALGQEFHLNQGLGVYVLHAWIWKNNPAGMFEDWNPRVSCP